MSYMMSYMTSYDIMYEIDQRLQSHSMITRWCHMTSCTTSVIHDVSHTTSCMAFAGANVMPYDIIMTSLRHCTDACFH